MKLFWYAVLILVFGGVFFYMANNVFTAQLDSSRIYYAYMNNAPLKVAIANTPETRSQGLSGLKSIPQNHGLLFVFPENEKYGIWMKGMLFDLDIIWLNEQMRVVFIKDQVRPDTYPTIFYPPTNARYVLETNAGFVEEQGIQEGDKLKLISFRPSIFNFGGIFSRN